MVTSVTSSGSSQATQQQHAVAQRQKQHGEVAENNDSRNVANAKKTEAPKPPKPAPPPKEAAKTETKPPAPPPPPPVINTRGEVTGQKINTTA